MVDPVSGEPELKHTPVAIEPFVADWYGVIYSRAPLAPPDVAWWTRVSGTDFTRYEIVGRSRPDWRSAARQMLGVPATPDTDWIEYRDAS